MEAVSWLVSQISASLCFPVSLIDSQHINILTERWGYGSMGTSIYTLLYIYIFGLFSTWSVCIYLFFAFWGLYLYIYMFDNETIPGNLNNCLHSLTAQVCYQPPSTSGLGAQPQQERHLCAEPPRFQVRNRIGHDRRLNEPS